MWTSEKPPSVVIRAVRITRLLVLRKIDVIPKIPQRTRVKTHDEYELGLLCLIKCSPPIDLVCDTDNDVKLGIPRQG
jgi:hypothetical protein